MTFQENIWQILKQSFEKVKRRITADGRMKMVIHRETESEDLHYQLEWMKMTIQGTKEMEEDEYKDTLKMYDKLGKQFKKEFPVDNNMAKHLKGTKVLPQSKIEEAYKKGFGVVEQNSIVNKLLEMGILTHVEWVDDFNSRDEVFFG